MLHKPALFPTFLLLALLSLTPALRAQETARFSGQVINATTSIPILDALVRLYTPPVDDSPEHEVRSDDFGFFQIPEINPGEYALVVEHPRFSPEESTVTIPASGTNRVVRMQPIDADVFFDLQFDVRCLASHLSLADARITAEYWVPGGALTGAPDQVFTMLTRSQGEASLIGMVDGYYRFRIERTGWETIDYLPASTGGLLVVDDKVRLNQAHFASIYMEPIRQNLAVTVIGFDPVQNQPALPLPGMNISLTGIDPFTGETVIPTRSARSGEDGKYLFQDLPPISWKIVVGRHGYLPAELIVHPEPDATLAPATIEMDLEPTKLSVVLSSLYQTPRAVTNATIRLQGIRESNTEGVNRDGGTLPDAEGNTASALFENLLPGRYWIHVVHHTTIDQLPNRSGPLFAPDSFKVSFYPRETYAQVLVGETEEVSIHLDPVPARIRGRLMATDELANVEETAFNPEPNRVWHQVAHDGIVFREHQVVQMLPDGTNSFTFDSDEAGNYTALIPPGIFGVQIPAMANYTGHNIEFGDLTSGSPPVARPWPYADEWPYQMWEGGHHAAGLAFESGHDYQLDLFLHAHYINLAGRIQTSDEPFGDLILRMDADGSGVVSLPYSYLQDVGAEVVATGPQTYRAPILLGNYYVIRGVQPGTYTISIDDPNYISEPTQVTIAPWQAPGIIPAVAPFSPTYFFPGISHSDSAFNVEASWKTVGDITTRLYTWIPGEDARYSSAGSTPPDYFRMSSLPDRLFSYNYFGDGIPPDYTIWVRHGDGWFSASGNGPAEYEAFENGPNENTPANQPPSGATSYTLDLHAYSSAHPSVEIPDVTVHFQDAPDRPAGGEVAHEGRPYPSGATHAGGQWFYAGASVEVLDSATRLVRVDVLLDRAMLVTGRVHHADVSLPGAAVVLRNRYGNPIGRTISGTEGEFRFEGVSPQPVFVDVNRRGFIPSRVRFDFDPEDIENPDTGGEVELQQVPAPTIEAFTMNRFGLFLPGVSKSGDSKGFNPEAAREKLTLTWKAATGAESFSYSLPGFIGEDGQPKPAEQFIVQDQVVEVWLIDRRAFTNAFVNDLNQEVHEIVAPPAQLNLPSAQEWFAPILGAVKDGHPYYVIHRVEQWQLGSPDNQFEGRLNLWELPSGAFTPMLVAITESGGVAVKQYELPPDKPSLQGLNLPAWASKMLEVIGLASNLPKFQDSVEENEPTGLLNIDTLTPTAQAFIGLDPFTNSPAMDNSLTYKYVLGVNLSFGTTNGTSGPMSAGPKFLGYEIPDLTAEFEVAGKDKEMALGIVFPVEVPGGEETARSYGPSIAGGSIQVVKSEFSGGGKLALVQVLNTNWLGENTLAKFGLLVEMQGMYDLGLSASASLLSRPFPALSAALAIGERLGVRFYGVFKFTGGAKYARKVLTEYPALPGGTIVRGEQPPDVGFLGRTESTSEAKIILRVGVGAQAVTRVLSGEILAQLGAPPGTGEDGIVFTINTKSNWPPVTKIEGAFTILAQVGVRLWTTTLDKSWRLVDVPFIKEFGVSTNSTSSASLAAMAASSGPGAFFLMPMDITYTVINAASSPPETFVGNGSLIVDQFYPAGSFQLSSGAGHTLVYTGLDPDTGHMKVMAARRNGESWSTPVEVAQAPGLISLATLDLPNGATLVAWSEISAADLANPFPAAALKFSLFDPISATWSDPAAIIAGDSALFDLQLLPAGEGAMLLYLATSDGPVSETATLHSTTWDGVAWTQPIPAQPALPIASFQAAPLSGTEILGVARTPMDELLSFVWNGAAWGTPATITTNAIPAFSLASSFLAWTDPNGALTLSQFDPLTGAWSHASPAPAEVLASECRLLPLTVNGLTRFLVVWPAGSDTTEIWAAYLDETGAFIDAPRQVTLGSDGTYSGLQLTPLDGYRALILARHATDSAHTIRQFSVGLSVAGDCDGNGTPDADQIASGASLDCNANGIPDLCEILISEVRDENANGIPDDCETALDDDCNRNGLSDTIEITLGLGDLDGNGLLDACETVLQTKIVTLDHLVPGKYYRAPSLRIVSPFSDSLELEYEGTLEQADQVHGPWTPVP